ncbi:DMT family transporter [Desulfopila inferna]|uniref:DMT family transporter n=1 Tax=Desulfopila inferna TaxID=468528 RepID=UPI001965A046|nr:DMT family transporter [Desulfopila inferna]MBM9605197.1 DMT family transporter [Desulfopila inferna]
MPFTGVIIAISTVFCWTISVQFFEAASKKVGPTPVNIIRIGVALLLFSVFLLIRDGAPIPFDFPLRAWLLLSLSGIIGFFIGDIFLFKALVELGPRLAMLLHSLAAPTAAVIGWIFLDEKYLLHQWLGIAVTLSGVALVILEKNGKPTAVVKRMRRNITMAGLLFGLLAMLGQACGMVLSKAGMQSESGYLDAFAATQIRAIAAFVCFSLFFTITHRWVSVKDALSNRKALLYTSLGAVLGPFLGVSLALLALHHLSTGVASTIFSLVPICILPFSVFLHKEHVSIRAVAGAFIAIFGIFLLTS